MSENAEQDKDKALFANLVMMLSASTMQYLGKIADPVTHETDTDLDSAQAVIDMLTMLQTRTRDSLEDGEAHMLNDVLASLRMNYVDTAKAAGDAAAHLSHPVSHLTP